MVSPAGVSVDVVVEVSGGLSRLLHGRSSLLTRLLTNRVRDFLRALGLPGRPTVRVIEGDPRRAVRVRVQGTLLPYPPSLLRRCWLVSTISRPGPSMCPPAPEDSPGQGFPSEWLDEGTAHAAPSGEDAELANFVALVVLGVLRDCPSSLLCDGVVDAYEGGDTTGARPSNGILREVLGTLLDLGVPAVRRTAILEALEDGDQPPPTDVAERLFNLLRPVRVEIRAAGSYLAALGCAADVPRPVEPQDGVSYEHLTTLERALLADGVHVPDLFWAPVDAPSGIVAVNVNGVQGVPARALDPDEYLVDRGETWMAEHNIPFTRTLEYPLTGRAHAVVHERDVDTVIGAGGNLMPPGAYLAVLVYRDLSARPDRLIGIDESLYDLAILHRYQPVLVESALRIAGVADVTRLRRAHAAAGLPVKDLRLLLEHLLVQAATQPAHTPDTIVQATRDGLANQLMSRFALESEAPTVVELGTELVARLAAGPPLREEEQERIRDDLWTELRGRRLNASRFLLVVPAQVLAATRALLKPEFPEAAVVAPAELPDGLEPEAALSLTGMSAD